MSNKRSKWAAMKKWAAANTSKWAAVRKWTARGLIFLALFALIELVNRNAELEGRYVELMKQYAESELAERYILYTVRRCEKVGCKEEWGELAERFAEEDDELGSLFIEFVELSASGFTELAKVSTNSTEWGTEQAEDFTTLAELSAEPGFTEATEWATTMAELTTEFAGVNTEITEFSIKTVEQLEKLVEHIKNAENYTEFAKAHTAHAERITKFTEYLEHSAELATEMAEFSTKKGFPERAQSDTETAEMITEATEWWEELAELHTALAEL
ncbi:MAG: hypothetical protein OXG94_05820 [Bacteroidetes bacterium]|nr:hypothetical protein [Bacteroidota bacterium]